MSEASWRGIPLPSAENDIHPAPSSFIIFHLDHMINDYHIHYELPQNGDIMGDINGDVVVLFQWCYSMAEHGPRAFFTGSSLPVVPRTAKSMSRSTSSGLRPVESTPTGRRALPGAEQNGEVHNGVPEVFVEFEKRKV